MKELNKKRYLFIFLISLFTFFYVDYLSEADTMKSNKTSCMWEICSIDTMKTSRDRARKELSNPDYDTDIQKQLAIIKNTGANYVAIDTPYDEEFLPYLRRWVNLARKTDLKVWFRGNWSEWEGWFDYPKTLSPDEHLEKTRQFIENNPDLFENGDIFDACPECENAGHWPQPGKDKEYNEFIQKQKQNTQNAFDKIDKQVISNLPSIIGGRAREVLDQKTFDTLGNVVTIDHYIKDPNNMGEYIDYFSKEHHTKVVVSEFGAPIPDINGFLSEEEQAAFINELFTQFYIHRHEVRGVNYNVLSEGTTSLVNTDYSSRDALTIIKNFYSPSIIRGKVTNTLGEPLKNITIQIAGDSNTEKTDKNGEYAIPILPGTVELTIGNDDYKTVKKKITSTNHTTVITQNSILRPQKPGYLYQIREFFK